ncbi:MAG: DEAD/DEAH box helicase [Candidatus Methanoperedens sp.]|nr:DEAD/DEAH box helicase [Candidatus Methanoperedens sp.]
MVLVCQECENREIFRRTYQGLSCTARSTITTPWRTGPWVKADPSEKDGFYCGNPKCSHIIEYKDKTITESMLKECRLDRPPIPDFDYKADEILEDLNNMKNVADGVEIKKGWRKAKKADRSRALNVESLCIPNELLNAIKASPAFGIDIAKDLYSHQVEAIEEALCDKNVIVTTPTASGKSICYLVPILKSMIEDEEATALLLFPSIALLQDQFEKVLQIGNEPQDFIEGTFEYDITIGNTKIGVGLYIGDTKDGMRHQKPVRENARLLFSTPDALHAKVLPYIRPTNKTGGASFIRFFENLRIVVMDDIHIYRGVFGANIAFLLRRLRLLCEKIGNDRIQFLLTSATIENPKESAENLVGLTFDVVNRDGAEDFRKDFILWNPSKIKETGVRKEPQSDALEIMSKIIYTKERTPSSLVFLRSIRSVENFSKTFEGLSKRENLPTVGSIRVYHGVLSGSDRRRRQNEVKSRQVLCVASTNALELGIDLGNLACCIMVGFPGTVASTVQRAGRVGRKSEGTVILILGDNPLEQHLARNPDYFFQKLTKPEPVRIPLDNKNIIKNQILCHLAESSYIIEEMGASYDLPHDFTRYFGKNAMNIYQELLDENKVKDKKYKTMLWRPDIKKEYNNIFYTLRAIIGKYRFTLVSKNSEDAAGVIDEARAGLFFHEGAVWLQDGQWYESEGLNYSKRTIFLKSLSDEPKYETFASPEFKVEFDNKDCKIHDSPNGWFKIRLGTLRVDRRVTKYFLRPLRKGGESPPISIQFINNVKPIKFETIGLSLSLTQKGIDEFTNRVDVQQSTLEASIHGTEHAFATILPLQVQCDINDIFAVSSAQHETCDYSPSTILFDAHDGGLGLVKQAHDKLSSLTDETLAFVKNCKCKDGCPDCLHIPRCERQNEDINKLGTITILEMLNEAFKK